MKSSASINEAKNDIQVLLEKFRALTEALRDPLKKFRFFFGQFPK